MKTYKDDRKIHQQIFEAKETDCNKFSLNQKYLFLFESKSISYFDLTKPFYHDEDAGFKCDLNLKIIDDKDKVMFMELRISTDP